MKVYLGINIRHVQCISIQLLGQLSIQNTGRQSDNCIQKCTGCKNCYFRYASSYPTCHLRDKGRLPDEVFQIVY